jgi:hypothetical protein
MTPPNPLLFSGIATKIVKYVSTVSAVSVCLSAYKNLKTDRIAVGSDVRERYRNVLLVNIGQQ